MHRFAHILALVITLTQSLQAAPNFKMVNNSGKPVHFAITGANDLFGLRKGKIEQPLITTLQPGHKFGAEIELKGILLKHAQLDFFENPQGTQQTVPVRVHIPKHKQTIQMPVGAHRIYKFVTNDPIDIQILSGLEVRPVPGARVAQKCIQRSVPFEHMNQWSSRKENQKQYCEFQEQIYPFVYELVKAGGVGWFLWKWPVRGIPWAIKIKFAERRFRKSTGIEIVPQKEIDKYSSKLGA